MKDGPCAATLESFHFYLSWTNKTTIRQFTQTAVVKYLVLDKRPVIVGYIVWCIILSALNPFSLPQLQEDFRGKSNKYLKLFSHFIT